MMNQGRRRLLQMGSVGLATAALPSWIRACEQPLGNRSDWGQDDGRPDVGGKNGPVLRAFRAGRDRGRPLLVLTIPPQPEPGWESGRAWGQVLNTASPDVLAALAMCEVVCAETSAVREALPGVPGLPTKGGEQPIALLIETDNPRAVPVPGSIDAIPIDFMWGEEEKEAKYEAAVRKRVKLLGERLIATIAPDRATLERRARQAARASGHDAITLHPGRDAASSERAARVPAMVRLAAEDADAVERKRLIGLLAGFTVANLRSDSPAGACWAVYSGCGVTHEGREDDSMVACGMAYVPEISQRFLDFYVSK